MAMMHKTYSQMSVCAYKYVIHTYIFMYVHIYTETEKQMVKVLTVDEST